MAKATIHKRAKKVRLELSLEEAVALRTVFQNVGGHPSNLKKEDDPDFVQYLRGYIDDIDRAMRDTVYPMYAATQIDNRFVYMAHIPPTVLIAD